MSMLPVVSEKDRMFKNYHKTRKSKQSRAGIAFSLARLTRHLRKRAPNLRLGAGAPVFLAATIEYLTAEILELAGNISRANKKVRIRPHDIRLAIGNDADLSELCQNVTFSEGGNMVHIHGELIPGHPKTLSKRKAKIARVKRSKAVKVRPKNGQIRKASSNSRPSALVSHATAASSASGSSARPPAFPSTTLGVLSTGTLFLGQKMFVVMGDISSVSSDAIVHPTNATYSTSGQVGQILLRKGGAEYQAALDNLKGVGNLASCGASICEMFNIEAKKIIHCNSPSWNRSNDVGDLQKTIENCLKLADKENLRSIALPSVGSGNAGWPKQLAAETILRSINRYFQTIMSSSIRYIYFVLYDKESVDVYTSELKRLLANEISTD